ncbi:hypothetical protein N7468_010438 [Penicillium chermesinum]|uniref:RNase III domain-containing protein n=1 Tax=Penicillium chermesinum TaxID=63820 RepID=A0A9W9TDC5_9EURO|nr:uncharacterized protein N7468_010438 [Penicillium chermesinum]KAJ5217430.1 hypothetical protein N7468_010438 [Penicillium chermesinum]
MAVEERIAHVERVISYSFKSKDLLRQALTAAGSEPENHDGNRKFAIIGDNLIRYITSCVAYKVLPSRSQIAALETTIVSVDKRASVAQQTGIKFCIKYSHRPGAHSRKVLALAISAILGAVHIDSGDHATPWRVALHLGLVSVAWARKPVDGELTGPSSSTKRGREDGSLADENGVRDRPPTGKAAPVGSDMGFPDRLQATIPPQTRGDHCEITGDDDGDRLEDDTDLAMAKKRKPSSPGDPRKGPGPESVVVLKSIVETARAKQSVPGPLTPAVVETNKSRFHLIELLGDELVWCRLLRFVHILELYKACGGAETGTSSGFVNSTVSSMRSQPGRRGNPLHAAESQILPRMMAEILPELMPGTEVYDRKQSELKKLRLLGRRLSAMASTFGPGVLGLMMSEDSSELAISEATFQRIPENKFKEFIRILDRSQGALLRTFAAAAQSILDVLIGSTFPAHESVLERAEPESILQYPKGSDELLTHLSML